LTHFNETTKHIVDAISVTTVVGTLTAWLPPIAALLSIIWTALRIYEMITGKQIADRRKITRL
jgi:hypothetical protein